MLVCQETSARRFSEINDEVLLEMSAQDDGRQRVASRRELVPPGAGQGRCTLVRPDIDGLLPVYVLDRYEGFQVERVIDLSETQRRRFAKCQAAAAEWVLDEWDVDGALVNHAIPLPSALAPVFTHRRLPYAVKVHGSELEYALREDSSLVAPARAGLAGATSVLVGSQHVADRTVELLGEACIAGRVHIAPPGVDIERFAPSAAADRADALGSLRRTVAAKIEAHPGGRGAPARESLRALVPKATFADLPPLGGRIGDYQERHIDADALDQLEAVNPDEDRLVAFVGKLIPQKALHLALLAWPLVLQREPRARLLIAGFGPAREHCEAFVEACTVGRRDLAIEIANRLSEAALPESCGYTFSDLFTSEANAPELGDGYWRAARSLRERTTWLGLVDHDVLADAWPLCEASIVPSLLAEAFGMVAAEAAACGTVPIVGDHSGLADAATIIERGGVGPLRVPIRGRGAVSYLAASLIARLALSPAQATAQAEQARRNVVGELSWSAVAKYAAELMRGERSSAMPG